MISRYTCHNSLCRVCDLISFGHELIKILLDITHSKLTILPHTLGRRIILVCLRTQRIASAVSLFYSGLDIYKRLKD